MSSPARSKERDALLDTPDEMAVVGRKEGRYVCVCVCVWWRKQSEQSISNKSKSLLKLSIIRWNPDCKIKEFTLNAAKIRSGKNTWQMQHIV